MEKKDKREKKLKLYHSQALELLKSLEGRNLAGKVFKNNQKIKDGWFHAAEDILLKIIDLDENSVYLEDIRQKLYGNPNIRKQ